MTVSSLAGPLCVTVLATSIPLRINRRLTPQAATLALIDLTIDHPRYIYCGDGINRQNVQPLFPTKQQTSKGLCKCTGEHMQTNAVQQTSGVQLDACIGYKTYGHHLAVSSFVPSAKPEHQVKFSGTFSTDDLRRLHDDIDQTLGS